MKTTILIALVLVILSPFAYSAQNLITCSDPQTQDPGNRGRQVLAWKIDHYQRVPVVCAGLYSTVKKDLKIQEMVFTIQDYDQKVVSVPVGKVGTLTGQTVGTLNDLAKNKVGYVMDLRLKAYILETAGAEGAQFVIFSGFAANEVPLYEGNDTVATTLNPSNLMQRHCVYGELKEFSIHGYMGCYSSATTCIEGGRLAPSDYALCLSTDNVVCPTTQVCLNQNEKHSPNFYLKLAPETVTDCKKIVGFEHLARCSEVVDLRNEKPDEGVARSYLRMD